MTIQSNHVHCVVDADAAAAIARGDFRPAIQNFYATYGDDYDFLYIVHDQGGDYHFADLDETRAQPAVRWSWITKEKVKVPASGWWKTGKDDIRVGLRSETPTRLRGYAGFPGLARQQGPTIHETAHAWANFLDVPGFAEEQTHWGFTGVNGSLGGFDPGTLRDAATGGEITAETRTVRVAAFGPATSNDGKGYGKLELYLMGLIPPSDVPDTIVLKDPQVKDWKAAEFEISISGHSKITIADVIAAHGQAVLLQQPAYRGAFILVTPEPDDAAATRVERWAQVFGGELQGDNGLLSFADATGGLATMNTRLA